MKTRFEIEEELLRIDQEIEKNTIPVNDLGKMARETIEDNIKTQRFLNTRKWALKWVLESEA